MIGFFFPLPHQQIIVFFFPSPPANDSFFFFLPHQQMIGEWWLCCAHMKSSLAGQKQSRTQPFSQLLHAAISHDCYVRAVCATISMTAKNRRTQPFRQLLHATIIHDSYVRAVCATISMTAAPQNCSRRLPRTSLFFTAISHTHTHTLASVSEVQCWK